MEAKTIDAILWIFCIVILTCLSGKVYYESSQYDCEQCTVTLQSHMVNQPFRDAGEYKIKTLFETYINEGRCIISWDPVQGYIHNQGGVN